MFTGIVEEIGKIKSFEQNFNGADLTVECKKIIEDIHTGDSISVNGCCQTVIDFGENWFKTNLSPETMKITAFSNLKIGKEVNLERALKVDSRLGGHIVQGHVDGVATVENFGHDGEFYIFSFTVSPEIAKYIVKKGAITVDGISLTVSYVDNECFQVAVIPHTFKNTILQFLKNGDKVNIETDIIGRYAEKLIHKDSTCRINEDFLKVNGFV